MGILNNIFPAKKKIDMVPYQQFTLRNKGFISHATQEKIRNTRLLIAGCGIGSTVAETAARAGFQNFVLADADTISVHNLNRQNFVAADVGVGKVDALATRLRAINPNITIKKIAWITRENVYEVVASADLILDTIDLLSIDPIIALHDTARKLQRPVISAVSAGWGGGAFYFPFDGDCTFRHLFGLPAEGSVEGASYVKHFSVFLEKIADHVSPIVLSVLKDAMKVMEDGTPCPASHVSVGGATVAALAVTMTIRILNGDYVTPAPELILVDLDSACSKAGINIAG